MTFDRALDIIRDVSYFGTMMVHLGHADGMVSGRSPLDRPHHHASFEIIKTAARRRCGVVGVLHVSARPGPGVRRLRCHPEPTVDELADIAIASAATAARFGVEPRIAMLSYSTGESGSGADVEKVRAATPTGTQNAAPT